MSQKQTHSQFPTPGNDPIINYSLANPNVIYVGDLSFFCVEEHLSNLFSHYGRVLKAEVKRGKATGDSLLHGYVEMESPLAANSAFANLQGMKFLGRRLRLSFDNPNPCSETDRDRENWIQIHVSFVTRILDKFVNEELLLSLFSAFGEVVDVTVKRHKISKDPKNQHGYGFVYFADIPASLKAAYTMKHTTIDGISYDSSFSHKTEERLRSLGVLVPTSGPTKSEATNHTPQTSIPHPMFSPAPPAVAVAVHPPYTTATNPFPTHSSSSYSRNPPTTVSPTLQPHPLGVYVNPHRQMAEQFPPGYDARPPPYPHHSSNQLPMQPPPPYNVGMLSYPQAAIIPPSTATPPSTHMATPPQYEFGANFPSLTFSPHQYPPPVYNHPLPASPYESYLPPPPPSHPGMHHLSSQSMNLLPDRARQGAELRHLKSRQRQGNLRRMEQDPAMISRSESREYPSSYYRRDRMPDSSDDLEK